MKESSLEAHRTLASSSVRQSLRLSCISAWPAHHPDEHQSTQRAIPHSPVSAWHDLPNSCFLCKPVSHPLLVSSPLEVPPPLPGETFGLQPLPAFLQLCNPML